MRAFLVAMMVALLSLSSASAHTFNHEDRHDECQVDLPPQGHGPDDGHAHTHVASELHPHDPCRQAGMERPVFADASPLDQVPFEEAVIGGPTTDTIPVILDTEALLTDVTDHAMSTNLIIVGDDMLAHYADLGVIHGSGSTSDPYVIEGKLIRNVLMIKDTSKCIVVRDNIVHSRALLGPIVLPEVVEDLRAVQEEVQETIAVLAIDLEAEYNAAVPDNELIAALEQEKASEEERLAEVEQAVETAPFRAGDHEADTIYELAHSIATEARNTLPHGAGRMILDWNGQCIHAYNNIVEDLRVNRNTMRTGYATGGLIEDNRFFHIGQIRHYDGEFRENEVGYRDHLWGTLPNIQEARPALQTWRAINGDGFNQGWYHHNLIFGSVDLDFHGHHHGSGFFAPESHYHGSDPRVAYMVNPDGSCAYPGHDYGQNASTVSELKEAFNAVLSPPEERCLAHHDHRARWTSANFEDNVVVDPFGYGVRYEDRNHAGDDRIAASEDMAELNVPHAHRTHVQMADNVIFGSLWIDVFNSPTVDVWSDDYSIVRYDLAGAVIGAAEHLGAQVLSSHPERNSGWLDIEGNVVYTLDKDRNTPGFHYGWAAYQINHAREADEIRFMDNQAYLLPNDFQPSHTSDDAFLADLEAGRSRDVDATSALVDGMGTDRSEGPTTFAFVFHDVRDSALLACGNAARGFDVGFYAWNGIMEDTQIELCDNDVDASFPELVRITNYHDLPADGPVTETLRALSDDTSFEPAMRPAIQQTQSREAWLAAYQEYLEGWAEQQLANQQRNLDRQIANQQRNIDRQQSNAEWTVERNLNNIDRIAAQQQWYIDYQAARQMSWVDYQVGRQMDQAEYQAARAMGYADWALMMAEKYTHSNLA